MASGVDATAPSNHPRPTNFYDDQKKTRRKLSVLEKAALGTRIRGAFQVLLAGTDTPFFRVDSPNGDDRAYVYGGITNDGFGVLMRMHGDYLGESPQVHFLDAGTPTAWVDVHAQAYVVGPSSEEFKDVIGERDVDAVAIVVDAPVKTWTKIGEEDERFSPSIEDLPPELVARSSDPEQSPGINLGSSVWTLWQAVQQQQATIGELQDRVAQLEQQIG